MIVGFVGLGSQGGPMAESIVRAGLPLVVWARRPSVLRPFVEAGATAAASLSELGGRVHVACVCVTDDDDVRAVTMGHGGLLEQARPGGIVCIHSTVHPDTCAEVAEAAALREVAVVDAPVSGGAAAARTGHLTVPVGGDPVVYDKVRPVLETFGDPVRHVGALGAALTMKLVNNTLFAANLALAFEALDAGASLGVDPGLLRELLPTMSGGSRGLDSAIDFERRMDTSRARRLLQKDANHFAAISRRSAATEGQLQRLAGAGIGVLTGIHRSTARHWTDAPDNQEIGTV